MTIEMEASDSQLSGPHRIAALMLSILPLDRELVGKLLKRFDQDELALIAHSASQLGSISANQITSLMEEFAKKLQIGPNIVGNEMEAKNLVGAVLPEGEVVNFFSPPVADEDTTIWSKLSTIGEEALFARIGQEPPQILAYILNNLPSEMTAGYLQGTPTELSADIVGRIVTLNKASSAAIEVLEEKLGEFVHAMSEQDEGREQKIADVLNQMDVEFMTPIMEKLRDTMPEDVKKIQKSLFDFSDIVKLPAKARSILFEIVPTEQTILALQDAESEIREATLSALGARTRRMIEQELNADTQVPQKDIVAARKSIANTALDMMRKGEIQIEDDEVLA